MGLTPTATAPGRVIRATKSPGRTKMVISSVRNAVLTSTLGAWLLTVAVVDTGIPETPTTTAVEDPSPDSRGDGARTPGTHSRDPGPPAFAEPFWVKRGGPVYAVAFSADGTTLASGSTEIQLLDIVSGKALCAAQRAEDSTDTYKALCFSPDGKHIGSV